MQSDYHLINNISRASGRPYQKGVLLMSHNTHVHIRSQLYVHGASIIARTGASIHRDDRQLLRAPHEACLCLSVSVQEVDMMNGSRLCCFALSTCISQVRSIMFFLV